MPQAFVLQDVDDSGLASPIPAAVQSDVQLDLQSPSSTLCQHLDPEALPRPDYFDSLDDLHFWYEMELGSWNDDDFESPSEHIGPPIPSSSHSSGSAKSKPKLLVCHDFQGGYNEDPQCQGYSLEHMHLVDTFIYFSHKRVSIPPNGWIRAAARTGTKVLGTLLFEWQESIPDLAKLFRGPERKEVPRFKEPAFSPQYAIDLIELAAARGFSGYLINVEVALDLGVGCSGNPWPAHMNDQSKTMERQWNAERLRGWVHYLREEGRRSYITAGKDPDEWEVVWYDSVVYPYGQLAWQDALNEHNISYFQAANTFFTNYTWAKPVQPLPPGRLIDPDDQDPQTLQLRGYGLTGPNDGGFHPQLLLSAAMADSVDRARSDVYVGIDVFGRNCWGGLNSWKSLDMIGPQRSGVVEDALGLSVALFAPGWTWEEENAGLALNLPQKRTWSDWWHVDSAFWTGIPSNAAGGSPHRITLHEDAVKPVQAYLNRSNLADDRCCRRASANGFYTNFSFGSGTKWFDGGELVYDWSNVASASGKADATAGFTDMGVSMPKPDLFFAEWQDRKGPKTTSQQAHVPLWHYDHDRVWAGNASFVVSLANEAGSTEVQSLRIPLCSSAISAQVKDATDRNGWQYIVVFDASGAGGVIIQPLLETSTSTLAGIAADTKYEDLGNGWKAASVTVPSEALGQDIALLTLGVTATLKSQTTTQVRIGALQLRRASRSPEKEPASLQIRPATDMFDSTSYDKQSKWLRASILSWIAPGAFLESMYCNVWVQQVDKPETRVWLGTSTREAKATEFCLPSHLALPKHLAQDESGGLEYVITSLDIHNPVDLATGIAPLL
ncbi:Glycoside hydrolase, family 85 [Kalmanozyma brasiliensis GHG001]|uniref:Cytosolic endo-beta-N-acetylglucosaminidase TIM barrel domain-containing protein n=1 Tax=Kalmanozyma brasiliensis (strain GHG001) TaxID=1365824 RepID=V5EYD6_KALBG|nr:Glycoside hydrolase, family 85 [Kalmanozyma brasiliensis GHG001]EST07724.1 Glycoside hydrolase, family 85 [Kalmanozyma brasiliensis GHG001]